MTDYHNMTRVSVATYRTRKERAALRSSLSDAAGICDSIGKQLLESGRTRSGKGPPSKEAQKLAQVARDCGDAIWAARDDVPVPKDDGTVQGEGQ